MSPQERTAEYKVTSGLIETLWKPSRILKGATQVGRRLDCGLSSVLEGRCASEYLHKTSIEFALPWILVEIQQMDEERTHNLSYSECKKEISH